MQYAKQCSTRSNAVREAMQYAKQSFALAAARWRFMAAALSTLRDSYELDEGSANNSSTDIPSARASLSRSSGDLLLRAIQ
ncbi:MAG: hypothetical protein DMF61_10740 [Blastocatellia bacterium AA13]|nr:MAG: hypothetical protein DMF61_10740 [Blastocatellia bacterium AA13]